MTVLVVAPGATVSTMDVYSGVCAGLKAHGVNVANYSLHGRIAAAERWLRIGHTTARRQAKREGKTFTQAPPTFTDVCYQACTGIFEKIFKFRVDAVLFISGVLIPKEVITTIKHAQMPVGLLLTESPYLSESELHLSQYADIVWTNERSFVKTLRQIQPRTHYLPHAWLPGVHNKANPKIEASAHDVVFVGTDFPERIELLEAVDWTGIDLGLYGNWRSLREDSPLKPFVRHHEIRNALTSALYRRAKVSLNLYRTSSDYNKPRIEHAESLNPRAYELAATGTFHVSTRREEVSEKFGELVPTFETPQELQGLLRYWLAHDSERQSVAARLPALVAEDTWLARGGQVIGDMRRSMTCAA